MIVVMVWGRPHEIVVSDLDESGEVVPVRTIRDGDPDPEWRRFSCRVEVWRTLQALAQQHGWVPAGTTLDEKAYKWHGVSADLAGRGMMSAESAANSRARFERAEADTSYEPRDWVIAKVVSGADAAAMADALEQGLAAGAFQADERPVGGPVYIRDGMTLDELAAFNRGVSAHLVRDFVAFLRRGPFRFAWDGD